MDAGDQWHGCVTKCRTTASRRNHRWTAGVCPSRVPFYMAYQWKYPPNHQTIPEWSCVAIRKTNLTDNWWFSCQGDLFWWFLGCYHDHKHLSSYYVIKHHLIIYHHMPTCEDEKVVRTLLRSTLNRKRISSAESRCNAWQQRAGGRNTWVVGQKKSPGLTYLAEITIIVVSTISDGCGYHNNHWNHYLTLMRYSVISLSFVISRATYPPLCHRTISLGWLCIL